MKRKNVKRWMLKNLANDIKYEVGETTCLKI